jgi:putative PIG3 family NAD(P)H quinone oxidoreductase
MKAIIIRQPGGPQELTWDDVPTPEPAAGEVLVRTVAAGVNRADLLQRQGHYPPPPGASQIRGLEASGVVERCGAGVAAGRPGDEVVALLSGGGYAEYFVASAGQCVGAPAGIDLATAGGLMEAAATVVSNMFAAKLTSGKTLLVHGGAGGVGSFAIQYAHALGCRVIATAGTQAKLAYCRSLGADEALDYHDDWADGVGQATGGAGVDVILDIIGAAYLEPNVRSLADDGRLIIIGMQKGARGTLDIARLLAKRGAIIATGLRGRPNTQKDAICAAVAARVWPRYADGSIKAPVTTFVPMAQAARAHELLESGQTSGKIVLVR